MQQCTVDGCQKPMARLGIWCVMHYMRMRRNGHLDLVRTRSPRRLTFYGYIIVDAPSHPLADQQGYVLEHRKVLYDKVGGIEPDCHWCGAHLTWDVLHADHLDDDKTNNQPDNIVPSCPVCNQARGRPKHRSTLLRRSGIAFNGEVLPKTVWAERLGLTEGAIAQRLASGWSIERALTTQNTKR